MLDAETVVSSGTMKVTCTRDELMQKLGVVSRGISTRTAVQILGGVLLTASPGRLELAATDMELSLRASLVESAAQQTSRWDALLMPTCPILPPFIQAVADDDGYNRYSMLLMRNTRVANVLDRCAVTLTVDDCDGLPVGMTLMGLREQDDALLGIAEAVEGLLPRRIA